MCECGRKVVPGITRDDRPAMFETAELTTKRWKREHICCGRPFAQTFPDGFDALLKACPWLKAA